jgi:hypothetical protein
LIIKHDSNLEIIRRPFRDGVIEIDSSAPTSGAMICIGNLNHLFSDRRYIAEPAKVSIVGAISEICGFASVGSGGTAVENARSVADRLALASGFWLSNCLE